MAQYMYGRNVAKQMLKDGKDIKGIYLSSNDKEIVTMAQKKKIPVYQGDRSRLTKLAGTDKHQGVVVEINEIKTYSVSDITSSVKDGEYGLIILCDELEDPHNLGAILRTADAVGANGVIFKKTNAVGLTPAVAKTSAGAISTVKCAPVTNLSRTIDDLKKQGWWVVGADMNGQDYRTLKYDFHTVLVIGNEGKGISRLVKEKCDYIISLPMVGKITSLNASVSAGILMYSIFEKRFPL